MGDFIELDAALRYLGLDEENFLNMCIASGCDYLENIKGIGINRAKNIICKGKEFLKDFQKFPHAPENYLSRFEEVKLVFLHQTVIDPHTKQTVPLSGRLDRDENYSRIQHYCGEYLFNH